MTVGYAKEKISTSNNSGIYDQITKKLRLSNKKKQNFFEQLHIFPVDKLINFSPVA